MVRTRIKLMMTSTISWSPNSTFLHLFSAVQNSSIGDLVTHSLTHWLSDLILTLQSDPWGLVTFETFDQSDEETGHDQKTDNDKDKYKDKDNDKYI